MKPLTFKKLVVFITFVAVILTFPAQALAQVGGIGPSEGQTAKLGGFLDKLKTKIPAPASQNRGPIWIGLSEGQSPDHPDFLWVPLGHTSGPGAVDLRVVTPVGEAVGQELQKLSQELQQINQDNCKPSGSPFEDLLLKILMKLEEKKQGEVLDRDRGDRDEGNKDQQDQAQPGDNVTKTAHLTLPVAGTVDEIQLRGSMTPAEINQQLQKLSQELQQVNGDSEQFQMLTNVLKTKLDAACAAIQNIR